MKKRIGRFIGWAALGGMLWACQESDKGDSASASGGAGQTLEAGAAGVGAGTSGTAGQAGEAGAAGFGNAASALALIGQYEDRAFSTQHAFTSTTWTQSSDWGTDTFEIQEFDNAAMWLVAQNGANNGYSPELFSRLDWTWSSGELWICQSVFDAESTETARAASRPDDSDPSAPESCGIGTWTHLEPASSAGAGGAGGAGGAS